MNITPETVSYAQRDYIYGLFKAETNVGPDGSANTGTNPSGKLASVASLGRKSIWPDFQRLPFVGVQMIKVKETQFASGRKHKIRSLFQLGVAVKAVAAPTGVILVDDAYDELEKLIDDGNGNGVMPIIRDHKNFNLGMSGQQLNAAFTLASEIDYNWDKAPQAKGVEYYAFAIISLLATVTLHV